MATITHSWKFDGSGATFDCDLSATEPNRGENAGDVAQGFCENIADFDIEIVGNGVGTFTTSVKGFFSSSAFVSVTSGDFGTSGGKKQLKDCAVKVFRFTQASSTSAFTVYITRRVTI